MIRRGIRRMRFLQNEVAGVHAAALILGAAGLASRLLGVMRDRMLAAHFGAGRELDIYNAAFNIPDFMATLFLLGAASAAILPVFQEYAGRDKERARQFIAVLAGFFLIGSSAAALAAFFVAPVMMRFIVPGFSGADQARTLALARVMLLSPILLGLSGIFSVVVQSQKRFFIYALAPLLYNLGIMFGIIVLVPRMGIAGVAAGVVIGALLHMGLQVASAAALGFGPDFLRTLAHLRERTALLGGDIAGVAFIAGPRMLALSLAQLTLVALDAIGSTLAPGSVAVLGFAQNLYFVPVGIFGVSYATAIFPRLVSAVAAGERGDFFRELAGGVRSILFWVAPASALCIVLRAHIVRLALGAGAFSWDNTRLVAAVLAALAFAMVAGATQTLLVRGFYALGNTWIPLAVNAAASLLSVALAFFFIHALTAHMPFARWLAVLFRIADMPHPEVVGLGLGFAVGLLLDVGTLYLLLMRYARMPSGGGSLAPGIAADGVKIIGAAVIAGVVAYLVRANFSDALPLITFIRVLIEGAVAATAGFAAYFAMLALTGSEDMALLRRAVGRRLFSLRILPTYWDGDEVK